MSDDISLKIEGIEPLIRKLKRFGPTVYRPALMEGGTHIKSVFADYPPRRFGKQPPKTMRQRIFLVNAIKEGLIDYPYRRGVSPSSEALGRRWTVEDRDKGLTVAIGNNASYVRWVHDAELQSEYHKLTGWKTDKQVAEEEAREVKEILARHIRAAIDRGAPK